MDLPGSRVTRIPPRDILRRKLIVASLGAAAARGSVPGVKALLFDVFGTVVDWRSSIVAEGRALGRSHGIKIDWERFADAWRAGYGPAMNEVRTGKLPWTTIDVLHRRILDRLLAEFGISNLNEDEVACFNQAWRRLRPWPDSIAGLARLKKRYIIATLSNGNIALLTNMAKHAALPWDCILSAELAGRYKPDLAVYRKAVELLDLKPGEAMMVAAHRGDLVAAAKTGMKTGFVARPLEYGAGGKADSANPGEFDVIVGDFRELAARLGT